MREARGNDIPLPKERVAAELDLDSEWTNQAQKLANLFAKELKLNPQEYIAGLPKFSPQPETFRGRFDIPVIVETRIPLARMLKLADIDCYFDSNEVKDWSKGNFKTPEKPYVAWVHDGARNRGRSVEKVRKSLAPDERGGTVFEGITLYLREPKILESHFLDLPGSQVGSAHAPSLRLWVGRLGLGCSWVGGAPPGCASVSCGRT